MEFEAVGTVLWRQVVDEGLIEVTEEQQIRKAPMPATADLGETWEKSGFPTISVAGNEDRYSRHIACMTFLSNSTAFVIRNLDLSPTYLYVEEVCARTGRYEDSRHEEGVCEAGMYEVQGGYAGRGYVGRGYVGRGYVGRGYVGRGYVGRGYVGRGYVGRGYVGRGYVGRGYVGRGYVGRGYVGRGYLRGGYFPHTLFPHTLTRMLSQWGYQGERFGCPGEKGLSFYKLTHSGSREDVLMLNDS